jgi:hypothetical protein
VTNVLDKPAAPLTSLSPERPKALELIVTKLLAKRAVDRYQSAADLLGALEKMGSRRSWRGLFGR